MRIVPAVFTRASRSSGSGVAAGTAVGDSAGGADVAAPPVEQAPATSTALTRSARRREVGIMAPPGDGPGGCCGADGPGPGLPRTFGGRSGPTLLARMLHGLK